MFSAKRAKDQQACPQNQESIMNCLQETSTLVAGASRSPKPVNQDSFAFVRNEKANLSAIIVADGLGSHYGAELASAAAVKKVSELLHAVDSGDEIAMPALFAEAWNSIQEKMRSTPLPPSLAPPAQDMFGTTLLCAIERQDDIVLGYVGNGAIYHIRGNFNTFPPSQLLPWSAVNYLNPHSVPENGQAAITRLLSAKAEAKQIVPTVLTIGKDQEWYGDIILCCSDGICSYDQTPIGYDNEREIWIHSEPAMPLFFAALNTFFHGPFSADGLTACLESYLHDLDARKLMDDDCTAAVLVTGKALEYQCSLHSLEPEKAVP